MEILRKTIKSLGITLVIFFALTLGLAVLTMCTGYKEAWTFIGLVILLMLSTLFLGYLEGNAVGRKGVFVGIISSAVFVLLVIIIIKVSFGIDFKDINLDPFLFVPLLSGAVGGVWGTNRNK